MGYINSAGLGRLWSKINSKISTSTAVLAGLQNDNLLINGNFQVWQRGNSGVFGKSAGYTCDRFRTGSDTGACKTEKTDVGMKVTMYKVGSLRIDQTIMDSELDLSGKEVTLSVKSTSSGNLVLHFYAYANGSWLDVSSTNILQGLTTVTCTVPAGTKTFCCEINSGDIPIDSFIELSYMKLEYGSIATTCNKERYGDVLQQCKRFYQIVYISGTAHDVNLLHTYTTLPVEMICSPIMLELSSNISSASGKLASFNPGEVDAFFDGVSGLESNCICYIQLENRSLVAGQQYYGVAILGAEKFIRYHE